MSSNKEFHPADYAVFASSLAICVGIGIYHAFCKKGKNGNEVKKSMSLLPASFSVMASFLAAPFVLGTPAEIYFYGTMHFLNNLGFGLAMPIVSFILIPMFMKLRLKSGHQYLELRFNKHVRNLANVVFGLMMLFYMGVVVYAPALAFSQVTGLPMLVSILGVGAVCIFYTSLGGLQAVMWIDVIQMLIILAGLVALAVKGSIDVGGVEEVWDRAESGGRIIFDEISPDPRTRHTWWTQIIGASFVSLVLIGVNQATIQKYLSVGDVRTAKKIPFVTWVLLLFYMILICYCGLVMYAYYHKCDPLSAGTVEAADQLIPLFVLDVLGNLYGIPGLFTAAVFSATLSTVAAGINALSFLTSINLVLPLYEHIKGTTLSPTALSWSTKLLAVFFGGMTIGLAYLAPLLGDILMQISLSIFGMAGGPLLGLFFLGLFFPCVNAIGASVGTITGLAMTFWVGIAAVITETNLTYERLELCTQCDDPGVMNFNDTSTMSAVGSQCRIPPAQSYKGGIHQLYDISYMWYTLLATLTTLIVGIIVSLITKGNSVPVPEKYLFSMKDLCTSDDDSLSDNDSVNTPEEKLEHMNGELPERNVYINAFNPDRPIYYVNQAYLPEKDYLTKL